MLSLSSRTGNADPLRQAENTFVFVKKLQLVVPPPLELRFIGASLYAGNISHKTSRNKACRPPHPSDTLAPFAINSSVALVSGLLIHGKRGLVLVQYICVDGTLASASSESSPLAYVKVKDSMAVYSAWYCP